MSSLERFLRHGRIAALAPRHRRRDRDLARTPKLGPLPLLGAAAVLFAVAGAAGLYLFLAWLLGVDARLTAPSSGQPKLPLADQQKLLADLVKIALGLAAGIGAAFALVVGYRRARVEEASSHRDDRRLFSSRYQDAADLIGSEKPAVRLAGIYAMARLADDWKEQQQQCIDVLCAYLRLPYTPAASKPPRSKARRLTLRRVAPAPLEPPSGEREVRLTVIRLITAHLQPEADRRWFGRDFEFTGAVFDGGDFMSAQFSSGFVDFTGAKFSGDVSFAFAQFSGAHITFASADFSDGTVDFTDAEFAGGSFFFGSTQFSGGDVSFSPSEFSGVEVYFTGTEFSGGTVDFGEVQFSGGTVDFTASEFSGGTVDFSGAQFSRGATITFPAAGFSGGTVDFSEAQFSGGVVDLSQALLPSDGLAPQHLPARPTAGLKLPDWLKPS